MSVSVDAALAGEIFDHFCNAGTLKSILRSYRLDPSPFCFQLRSCESENGRHTHMSHGSNPHESVERKRESACPSCDAALFIFCNNLFISLRPIITIDPFN